MFFYLSKALWLVFQPSSLMLGALILGVLLSVTPWRRLSRSLMLASLGAMLVFGLLPVTEVLLQPLEDRFPRPAPDFDASSMAGIIILGGVEDGAGWGRGELGGLGDTAERLTETLALARRYPGLRVVFSGGSAATSSYHRPETELAERVLVSLGLEASRLTLEDQSRNTHENALFSARLLKPQPGQKWLLVTSAAHMPRAIGCFRKAGFDVVALPVDYRTPGGTPVFGLNTSVPEGLLLLDYAAHEYVGLAVYHLTGRTDAMFPAP